MPKTSALSHIEVGDSTYSIGDTVLVKGEKRQQFIGRILEIKRPIKKSQGAESIKVNVAWFYRPEESLGGRKFFHGEKELFRSSHQDQIVAGSIEGHCRVLSLADYQKLETVNNSDFFQRFSYDPATHTYEPEMVAVHCKCELPYNPDLTMICCEQCDEWYHPSCLGMSEEEAQKMPRFTCKNCTGKRGPPPDVPQAVPKEEV